MSESKHTPGPWSIYDYGEEEAPTLVIHKDSNTRVCFLATPGSHGDPARIEADARLIAAAPELLAALQAFVDPDNAPFITQCDAAASKMMDDARVAIAKAEGAP